MSVSSPQIITFQLLEQMSIFTKQKLAEAGIPFSKYHSMLLETGEREWREPEKFRNRFKTLYSEHVNASLRSISWSSSFKVMELGAGYLSKGRSSLSRFLPEAKICYVDSSKKAADHAREQFPSINYIHKNSAQLIEVVEPGSLDVVIASCFLDTLPQDELAKTMGQISEILKPGGTFFHISDLEPYQNTLIIDNMDDPDIMFPCYEDDKFFRGIQFVSKADCEAFINRNSSVAASFLNQYIQSSNDQRAAVVLEISLVPEFGLILSKWVKETFTSRREIVNEQFFSSRLEEQLRINDFATEIIGNRLQSTYIQGEQIKKSDVNDVCSLHGRLIERNVSREDSAVRLTLGAHIIVARKKT